MPQRSLLTLFLLLLFHSACSESSVDVDAPAPPQVQAAAPILSPSEEALAALKSSLAGNPASLAELEGKPFTTVALSKSDAAAARQLLWDTHARLIRSQRSNENEDRIITENKLVMPYEMKIFGEKPAAPGGRSLWLSLHGGGGAPKQVNDQQWHNQKRLYILEEGIYLTPRAPTNTWNLWHEAHIDRMFARIIENLIVLEEVNPDRVYVLGYSAGGDGVYHLAPRMADHWAAAAMMAGHPNGVSILSLRNVPFALQVGANDTAYNRHTIAAIYGEQLGKLREEDPQGYEHFVKIHEGKGHWMDLEDKAALPWMARFTRNPIPSKIVWEQTGPLRDRSYWLAVPQGQAIKDSLILASRDGQTIDIIRTEKAQDIIVRLDDRMADLDQPVIIRRDGKVVHDGKVERTIGVMLATLLGRGDPKLVFDAQVLVKMPE